MAPPLVASCAHANNDFDAADLGSIWWHRDPTHGDIVTCDVVQRTARFTEEMMVVVDVRIEIRTRGINDDLAQEAGSSKLMKSIVDGREGYRDRRGVRFRVQLLGSDMPIIAVEQQTRQR